MIRPVWQKYISQGVKSTVQKLKYNTSWIRNAANPVLPPVSGSFDSHRCMNPWIMKDPSGERYLLYYAGADSAEFHRICLATAPVGDPVHWERSGPVFDNGAPGSFDGKWCVIPHLVRMEDGSERIYYTGNSGIGSSLDRFPGLGVAISEDGRAYRKYAGNPIIPVTGKAGAPDRLGIAGGSVMRAALADGTKEWRYYYTGCPTLGEDIFLDQQKIICLAVSRDGLNWEKRGAVMYRNPNRDYENVAVAGPVVHQHEDGSFRMWYSAIGTRWGYYSICYAESEDGIHWRRGTEYGDNLQLGPDPKSAWENQMVEYPSVIAEGEHRLRLFYTGNGYGRGGIGTALSTPLRATRDTACAHIADASSGRAWKLIAPQQIGWEGGNRRPHAAVQADIVWCGPDPHGTIWYECAVVPQVDMRVIILHTELGLKLRITLINRTGAELTCVDATVGLIPLASGDAAVSGARQAEFQWETRFADIRDGETQTAVGLIRY